MKRLDKTTESKGIDQSLNDAERAVEKMNSKSNGGRKQGNRRNRRRDSRKDSPRPGRVSGSQKITTTNLAARVASLINFNNPVGLPVFNVTENADNTPNMNYTIPGVCCIHYIPTFGPSRDDRSPLNQAKMQLFAKVRQGNTSNQPYDSPDLIIALMAVKSLLDMFMFAQRIYGIGNNFSALNRYLPDVLLAANHVSGKLFRNNLADYHYRLNVLASQVNMLVIPKAYTIFTDGNDYLSRVYLDDPEIKAQAYIFCPRYYYVYDETNGSALKAKPMQHGLDSYGDGSGVLEIISEQIDALLSSGTIGNIFGDMLRVFPDSELLRAAAVPVDYTVIPEYDAGMLTQINNMSLVGGVTNPSLDVTHTVSDNTVRQNMMFEVESETTESKAIKQYLSKRHFINVKAAEPDVADTYNATALQVQGYLQGNSTYSYELMSYGFIVPESVWIMTLINPATGALTPTIEQYSFAQSANYKAADLAKMAKFDWWPIMPIFQTTSAGPYLSDWFGDIANYTTIAVDDLLKFHEMRIMLAFNIPVV